MVSMFCHYFKGDDDLFLRKYLVQSIDLGGSLNEDVNVCEFVDFVI